jgi:hypothetical protein
MVAVALSPNVWHVLIHRCLQAVDDLVECVLAFAPTTLCVRRHKNCGRRIGPSYRSSALCDNPGKHYGGVSLNVGPVRPVFLNFPES